MTGNLALPSFIALCFIALERTVQSSLTVMGEYIKVSQAGIPSRYFDTIYLFESTGIMIGFKYVSALPECYVSTQDGF